MNIKIDMIKAVSHSSVSREQREIGKRGEDQIKTKGNQIGRKQMTEYTI